MKTVKTYEEWCIHYGVLASGRDKNLWKTAQANIPIKTCEWTYSSLMDIYSTSCRVGHVEKVVRDCCPNCGGKVTIKQTAEQQQTQAIEALLTDKAKLQMQLRDMTKERDVQIANNKAIMAELSVVTKERNRLCSRDTFMSMKLDYLQSDLNTAEKHLSELVSIDGAAASRHNASILVSAYIKRNGLDK